MNGRSLRARLAARILTSMAVVAMLCAHAHAGPIQIVKTFDDPLVGAATFQFTIEKFVFGVWVEIPCVDEHGSCTYQFSDLAAGTSIVLGDSTSASDSWLTNGRYFIEEQTPPGWRLGSVVGTGTSFLSPGASEGQWFFSFDLADQEAGQVTLHNTTLPGPATLALLGIGLLPLALLRRRRR